mmetsp:Transcript_33079/g.69454  ORF Transcript_33079/g.69454 Transcript_33079/m.69454 type:complete len:1360 (-) Transcript_33079:38-4117(-)
MGRATTRGSNRTPSSSNNRSSSATAITSKFDPAHPDNLKRSLGRNDVELAALTKLHVALRTLKEAIVNEFGEDTLLRCVIEEKDKLPVGAISDIENGEKNGKIKKTSEDGAPTTEQIKLDSSDDGLNNSDENDAKSIGNSTTPKSDKNKRLEQLTTAFLLRMKLRRRLLNRLARRLHRVAHIMDGGSNISAPLPPLYGDVVRRYVTSESENSGLVARVLGGHLGGGMGEKIDGAPEGSLDNLGVEVITEREVREFEKRENKIEKLKGKLEENKRNRLLGDEAGEKKKVVDGEDGYEGGLDLMNAEKGSPAHEGKSMTMNDNKAEADSIDGKKKESVNDEKDREQEMGETIDSMDDGEKKCDSPDGVDGPADKDQVDVHNGEKKEIVEDDKDLRDDEGETVDTIDDIEQKRDSMDDVDSVNDTDQKEDQGETDAMDIDNKESLEKQTSKDDAPAEEAVDSDEDDDVDEATQSKTEVDSLLRSDEQDRSLWDKLMVYEPGYDKVYSIGPLPPLPPPSAPSTAASPNADDSTGTKPSVDPSTDRNATDTPAKESSSRTENTAVVIEEKQILKVALPIVRTVDDHEVNDEGKFTSNLDGVKKESSRLPFTLQDYSAYARVLNPKERSAEWKRWTKEMCERNPEQVTFEELGVGGVGCVFNSEERLKRKREKALGDEADATPENTEVNRGKGKVLKKSSPEKPENLDENEEDRDVKLSGADEAKAKKEGAKAEEQKQADTDKEIKGKKRTPNAADVTGKKSVKTFSLIPVPSFRDQDLQRIKILQNDMVKYRPIQITREKILKASLHYEKTYKISIELQQQKATAMVDYNKLVESNKAEVADVRRRSKAQLSKAKTHWERRQFQLRDMQSKLGEEQALIRNVSNDILQDLKDRVCIRTAEKLNGSGLGTHRLKKVAEVAKEEEDENKEVSATVLGHMIDCVERRHLDLAANSPSFMPPRVLPSADTVIADPKTGETMSQLHARKLGQLKKTIGTLDLGFKKAEKARGDAWMALARAKGTAKGGTSGGGGGSSSGSVSKPKSRSRKSTGTPGGTSNSNTRTAATAVAVGNAAYSALTRGSGRGERLYPLQMQTVARPTQPAQPVHPTQPRGSAAVPGYVPASYYQGVRPPPTAASMMAAVARRSSPNTAASVIAARQMAAAGYVPGRVAGLVGGQAMGTNAQIAAMQGAAPQQRHQQQNPQISSGLTTAGRGALFHPVQNVPRSAAAPSSLCGLPAGGPAVTSSLSSTSGSSYAEAVVATTADGQLPKGTTLSKYGYGDKYSAINVNARKNPDGTVVPASTPKLLPDGRFSRPAGRQRKGMDWDSINGWWVPMPEGWEQQRQQVAAPQEQGGNVGGSNQSSSGTR